MQPRKSKVTVLPIQVEGCAPVVCITVETPGAKETHKPRIEELNYAYEVIPCPAFPRAVAVRLTKLELAPEEDDPKYPDYRDHYDVVMQLVGGCTCECVAASKGKVICKHIIAVRELMTRRLLPCPK